MTYNLQLMNKVWFYIEILEEGRQITYNYTTELKPSYLSQNI
jgi:hypothetical protein